MSSKLIQDQFATDFDAGKALIHAAVLAWTAPPFSPPCSAFFVIEVWPELNKAALKASAAHARSSC